MVVPIGFVSDHMEVVFDLDTGCCHAEECGMASRAGTAGDHPAFVRGPVDLMVERAAAARGEQPARPVVGSAPVGWYECRRLLSEPPGPRPSGPVSSAYLSIRHAWFWRSLAVPARATDRWAQTTLRSGNFRHVVAL